jgi:hypothetical protein
VWRPVDRESYVSRNLELLATFPTPRAGSTSSRPWTFGEGAFGGTYIAGYRTTRSFRAPMGTKFSDLDDFYRGDIQGWRRANWGRSFASGERSVCYWASLASICVRWLPHLDLGELGVAPFQVSVDSQAYADRDTSPW